MNKTIKLLKDWAGADGKGPFNQGDIIEVDEATFKTLVESKTAKEHDEAAEKAAREEEDRREAAMLEKTGKIVKAALDDYAKTNKNSGGLRIQVTRDESEQPFATLGDQLQAIKKAASTGREGCDPRLKAIMAKAPQGLSEQVASDGGFLLQPQWQTELFQLAHETGQIYAKTRKVTIGSGGNTLVWNRLDETSRVTGSRYGGIQAYWTAEAGTLTKSKPKFARSTMTLEKLAALYYATDEQLQDSPALGSMVSQWFAEEIGFMLDDGVIRGTGAGQMLGILNSDATIAVAAESGQAASTLVAENIEKMYARCWARSLPRAEWYINQDVWPQIFQFKHVVGTGGVPMFVPPGGLPDAPMGTLLGRKINVVEQCETLGTAGDIILADFGQYLSIEKMGVETAMSIHVQFLTDESAFRFILRVNGQPYWVKPLTPFKGSATQSPFITLATRS